MVFGRTDHPQYFENRNVLQCQIFGKNVNNWKKINTHSTFTFEPIYQHLNIIFGTGGVMQLLHDHQTLLAAVRDINMMNADMSAKEVTESFEVCTK